MASSLKNCAVVADSVPYYSFVAAEILWLRVKVSGTEFVLKLKKPEPK